MDELVVRDSSDRHNNEIDKRETNTRFTLGKADVVN